MLEDIQYEKALYERVAEADAANQQTRTTNDIKSANFSTLYVYINGLSATAPL
jgi:hypothetical protein